MEEIFILLKREIQRAEMEKLISGGVVLTGGTSLLQDVVETAESIFQLPCRLGKPRGISGLVDVVNNPLYATGVGLVIYGAQNQHKKQFRIRDSNIFHRIMKRMKQWFKDVI